MPETKEETLMKKMKRLISMIASTVLVLFPVLATPVTALANRAEDVWHTMDYEKREQISTGIPIEAVCNTSDEDFYYWGANGMFVDVDRVIAIMPEEATQEDAEMVEELRGTYYLQATVCGESFMEGDTVTVMLPISGTCYMAEALEGWELIAATSNSVTFECIENGQFICTFMAVYKKSSADEFWFKPMRTQLNIAAEIAASSGKEVVAEATGDFGLSYEIMKWLEDHPNVTLKYTLTYKEQDYNIVIKGGQKLADPKIPWYGPEYLIGKFAK